MSFAAVWGPYGGPPREEVFVRFGLSLSQFFDRLRDVLAMGQSDPTMLSSLASWYPVARPIG
ncbi:hypothetical protein [Rhodococcus koreensis]|uniref:hypothetical protein n=1 Tax=Rhodococcus koreensis TaxID=99653 RepID=UPI00366EEDFD